MEFRARPKQPPWTPDGEVGRHGCCPPGWRIFFPQTLPHHPRGQAHTASNPVANKIRIWCHVPEKLRGRAQKEHGARGSVEDGGYREPYDRPASSATESMRWPLCPATRHLIRGVATIGSSPIQRSVGKLITVSPRDCVYCSCGESRRGYRCKL
jgi:hypothetical protein